MAEAVSVPNFSDMEGYRTIVYDTDLVPDYIWQAAQKVQREELRSLLPADEQARADEFVQGDDFRAYRDKRDNPNVLVGAPDGNNADQLYRRTLLAVTFDRSNQLVGGALTADNSSARFLPGSLAPIEYWAKMLLRPGVAVPLIGNRRYVHLSDVFSHPDAQGELDVSDDAEVLSGVALNGIYHSLAERNRLQYMVGYNAIEDAADQELTLLSAMLEMKRTDWLRPNSMPKYHGKKVRVQRQVGEAMDSIMELPGARSAIGGMQVDRVSKKTEKQQEKELRKRNERATRDSDKAYWETKDWGK